MQKLCVQLKTRLHGLKKSKIIGIRIEEIQTAPIKFEYYTSTYDLKVIADKNAALIWARFYEIETNEPFFANRDGTRVYSLADVQRERRSGYNWYNDYGTELLEKDYPTWKLLLNLKQK